WWRIKPLAGSNPAISAHICPAGYFTLGGRSTTTTSGTNEELAPLIFAQHWALFWTRAARLPRVGPMRSLLRRQRWLYDTFSEHNRLKPTFGATPAARTPHGGEVHTTQRDEIVVNPPAGWGRYRASRAVNGGPNSMRRPARLIRAAHNPARHWGSSARSA